MAKIIILFGGPLIGAELIFAGCQLTQSGYESAPGILVRADGKFELRAYPSPTAVEKDDHTFTAAGLLPLGRSAGVPLVCGMHRHCCRARSGADGRSGSESRGTRRGKTSAASGWQK